MKRVVSFPFQLRNRVWIQGCLLALPLMAAPALAAPTAVLSKLTLDIPAELQLPYQGPDAGVLGKHIALGLGSGLQFTGKDADGTLHFVSITDRGPNADAPKVCQGDNCRESKIFLTPEYTPRWLNIAVKDGQATISAPILLRDAQGPVHGLPLPDGTVGATGEVALSPDLHTLKAPDARGLDTEGIAADGKGGYWVSDEYGPFLLHVDAQGRILTKFGPTAEGAEKSVATGLPSILRWRQPNRGFEGIAVLPSGKVIAAVQSTLDIDGQTAQSATFIRLLELDPATGKTRMLAYPLNAKDYRKSGDAKIGDLVAVDDHTVLAIEQGKDQNKAPQNRIYRIDLRTATDLSGKQVAGKEPEFASAAKLKKAGIRPVGKTLLLDLRALGWTVEKAEGLTIVDKQTLAVISDNDFGVTTHVQSAKGKEKKLDNFTTDGKGRLFKDGGATDAALHLAPLAAPDDRSALWLIHLGKPLR